DDIELVLIGALRIGMGCRTEEREIARKRNLKILWSRQHIPQSGPSSARIDGLLARLRDVDEGENGFLFVRAMADGRLAFRKACFVFAQQRIHRRNRIENGERQ